MNTSLTIGQKPSALSQLKHFSKKHFGIALGTALPHAWHIPHYAMALFSPSALITIPHLFKAALLISVVQLAVCGVWGIAKHGLKPKKEHIPYGVSVASAAASIALLTIPLFSNQFKPVEQRITLEEFLESQPGCYQPEEESKTSKSKPLLLIP